MPSFLCGCTHHFVILSLLNYLFKLCCIPHIFKVPVQFSFKVSVSTTNGAHCIKTTKSPSVVVAESHNITSQWSHKIRTDSMGYHRITISNKKLYKITKESSIVGDQSCLRSELINQLNAQAVWPPVTEICREIVTNRVAGGLNP